MDRGRGRGGFSSRGGGGGGRGGGFSPGGGRGGGRLPFGGGGGRGGGAVAALAGGAVAAMTWARPPRSSRPETLSTRARARWWSS